MINTKTLTRSSKLAQRLCTDCTIGGFLDVDKVEEFLENILNQEFKTGLAPYLGQIAALREHMHKIYAEHKDMSDARNKAESANNVLRAKLMRLLAERDELEVALEAERDLSNSLKKVA